MPVLHRLGMENLKRIPDVFQAVGIRQPCLGLGGSGPAQNLRPQRGAHPTGQKPADFLGLVESPGIKPSVMERHGNNAIKLLLVHLHLHMIEEDAGKKFRQLNPLAEFQGNDRLHNRAMVKEGRPRPIKIHLFWGTVRASIVLYHPVSKRSAAQRTLRQGNRYECVVASRTKDLLPFQESFIAAQAQPREEKFEKPLV